MPISFMVYFFLILSCLTHQRTTVFQHQLPCNPRVVDRNYTVRPQVRDSLAVFLRNPKSMPVHIPIAKLDESLINVAETLEMHDMHPYNPDLGLYGNKTQQRLHRRDPNVPWVEEPTLFDLVRVFNAHGPSRRLNLAPSARDKINMVAVCDGWEAPARVYTELQLLLTRFYGAPTCLLKPLWCKERCELLPTVGGSSFTPPKCAAAFFGEED
ncbi:hypothetical protein F5B19DRAFT_479855, partial [Rostrohypoxylon terebratum]